MKRPQHVVSTDELEWRDYEKGEQFAFRAKRLARPAGGRKIGCTCYEIPPGKRPFPYHFHAANEEAIYVLDGQGALRLGGDEHAIGAGDYVALPPGESGAHQIVNTGDRSLRVLVFSTMIASDVAFYPDTGKIGAFGGAAPGGDPRKMTVCSFFRSEESVDYYEGEEE